MQNRLLNKYNIPAPRYTSYPTVPYWQVNPPTENEWIDHVQKSFAEDQEISLYIHLPYCEKMCTYCGCNKRITMRHEVEQPYIKTVLKEWKMYLNILPEKPIIRELHLGGGTPTFFSPENLGKLLDGIFKDALISENPSFSFEAHPANTTKEHLQVLADHGFRRISIGVQDFDNEILRIINRQQSYEQVERCVNDARSLGYESVNFDLIFGLPFQTPKNIWDNFAKLKKLRPDRIAYYSYAHVPWKSKSQRAYSEADLPFGAQKRKLYDIGRELLEEMGYHEIGMDHFALPGDELYTALKRGKLHRNFMGYTPYPTRLNLALGVSSISDSWTAFVQNEKIIEKYTERIEAGEFPILKGHLLNEGDQVIRRHILNLMCNYKTSWSQEKNQCQALFEGIKRMVEMLEDELVHYIPDGIEVTKKGQPFIRNICMALDAKYWKRQPEKSLFSQVV